MKKWIALLCCLLLLPLPCWGQEGTSTDGYASGVDKDTCYAGWAASMRERKADDGAFYVMGNDDTYENFARDTLTFDVTRPWGLTLKNTLFHRQDFRAIQALIDTYHRYYYSAVLSGLYTLMPREWFANDGIYEEANAAILYHVFSKQDFSTLLDEADLRYEIERLTIDGSYARVVIRRSAAVMGRETATPVGETVIERNVREGYFLEKIDGQWRIENILFDNSDTLGTDAEQLIQSNQQINTFALFTDAEDALVWRGAFSFEKCQRKDYTPFDNYSTYIIGDITAPNFDYQKLVDDRNQSWYEWQQAQGLSG